IFYQKTTGAGSPGELKAPPVVGDYILWYAKNSSLKKFNKLYRKKEFGGEGATAYRNIELVDGSRMSISEWEEETGEVFEYGVNPSDSRVFAVDNITSQAGDEGSRFPIYIDGKEISIKKGSWKSGKEGMEKLISMKRVILNSKGNPGYVRYFDDFPYMPITSLWTDTVGQNQFGQSGKVYVVQTALKAIERCILMSTDPGDIVLD